MRDADFWDQEYILKDYLLDTNMSMSEIAQALGISQGELKKLIKEFGLEWIRRNSRKVSRGQAALTKIIQQLLPNEKIEYEYHLGDRLRLDIYLPGLQLGFEYHGRQHFFYSNLFFDSMDDFKAAQERDVQKEAACREQGIALVVFRFTDKLTEQAVFERIVAAIKNTPVVKEEKVSRYKGNPYYEKRKEADREYRRRKYREMKRKQRGN